MIYQIFAVYDSQTKAFLTPFFARTADEAQRMIKMVMRDPEHVFTVHNMDYSLFYMADFDDVTGVIEPDIHERHRICHLKELLPSKQIDIEEAIHASKETS